MKNIIFTIFVFVLAMNARADFSFKYNGHTYEVVTTAATWDQALADSRTRTVNGNKGYLAQVDDSNENATIFTQLKTITDVASTTAPDGGGASYVWIGANDIGTEGDWVWENDSSQFWQGRFNGSVINGKYNNWGLEPDDFNSNQDAAGIGLTNWPFGEAGKWNDVDKNNNLYYLIEYNADGLIAKGNLSTVSSALDIYIPSALYQNLNIWVSLKFVGIVNNNEYIWKLETYGVNSDNVTDSKTAAVLDNLNIQLPSIEYAGSILSTNLEFKEIDNQGNYLWKLIL